MIKETNIRKVLKEARIEWPSIPFNYPNFSDLYMEFSLGVKEPEIIFMPYELYGQYKLEIEDKLGTRLADIKVLDGIVYQGYKFRNAIIVATGDLADNELKIFVYYDKEATNNVKSLEGRR